MEPELRYCTSAAGTSIAVYTLGQGPPCVYVAPWVASSERDWEHPEGRVFSRLSRRDASWCGLITAVLAHRSETWMTFRWRHK